MRLRSASLSIEGLQLLDVPKESRSRVRELLRPHLDKICIEDHGGLCWVCMDVCIYVCMYVCMYVYVCACVCVLYACN